MKIKVLLGSRTLIEPLPPLLKSKAGLILPTPLSNYVTGKIAMTGTFLTDHPHLKPGKFCMFRKGTGQDFQQQEGKKVKDYLILMSQEIIFVGDDEELKNRVLLGERYFVLPHKEEQGEIFVKPQPWDLLKGLVIEWGSECEWKRKWFSDSKFVFYKRNQGIDFPVENECGDEVKYRILGSEQIFLAE